MRGRLARQRQILVSTLVMLLTVGSLAGCFEDEGGSEPTAGRSTTTTTAGDASSRTASASGEGSSASSPDVDATVASLRELLASTPSAIAADLSLWGGASVTAQQVEGMATSLCGARFDPSVTENYLRSELRSKTFLLLNPAMRLLRLAGQPGICSRPATDRESELYRQGMYRFLLGQPATAPVTRSIPDTGTKGICDFLGSKLGGDIVQEILGRLLKAASRNHLEPGGLLALTVEVAGNYCETYLPRAKSALERYFSQ